ncbi:hypothetical protein Y032_0204g1873 [Ancylostoma ceylanicum]|uniref:Uncharacterized protein n=1 Tax=Ancylostoma ceylanicum TaxID=53326 RepID=A0A016SMI4_9BILA|nr:hypothetical protein Y032_0204g1873 [Ancylostoma ceylanicum]
MKVGMRFPAEVGEEAPASMLRLSGLVVTFAAASSLLYLIWSYAPSSRSTAKLAFPRNLDDLRELADELEGYKDAHPLYTAVIFGYAYLYKQTFAIPGSFFLCVSPGTIVEALQGRKSALEECVAVGEGDKKKQKMGAITQLSSRVEQTIYDGFCRTFWRVPSSVFGTDQYSSVS